MDHLLEGASLPTPPRCAACLAPLSPEALFCPECGHHLAPRSRNERLEEWNARWRSVRSVIRFYALYLGTILPLYFVGEANLGAAMLAVDFADMALIGAAWRLSPLPLLPLLRPSRELVRHLPLALFFLGTALAVNLGYHDAMERFLGIVPESLSGPYLDHGLGWGWLLFSVCLVPGFWEEIAFRGLIWDRLHLALGSSSQVLLISSILFCAIHRSVFSAPILFMIGIVLGTLRLRTGSLIPGMAVHALHNLAVILVEVHGKNG